VLDGVSFWKTTLPVAVYRLTGGRAFGRLGGQPVLLLRTTGRRSGQARTTPVQYLRDGGSFIVVAANGGAARPPAWLLNLRAKSRARVQIRSDAREVIAREVAEPEYEELWQRLTAANPALEKVARRAGRRLPILVLSTAGAADEGTRHATPRGLTDDARDDWAALIRPTPAAAPFDPAATAALPDPVRRWLSHAIARGAPLRAAVELQMRGEIRLGSWRPFTASQRLSPAGGFIWAATARLFGLPIVGFDRFTRDSGQMRWRVLDVVPLIAADGPDITRSASGRHAGELLLASPAAALDPQITWTAVDADHATARLRVGGHEHAVTITVAPSGALTELVMTRWGNPGKAPFGPYPFGATLQGEVTCEGFTIPRTIAAGWHYATERWDEGQFIRYSIDHAHYA
jgi:deazaflavin-dependent oxidoreductase (nitroreductase family)